MPTNSLFYYMQQVQRRAGLTVSSSFPASLNDEQQFVLDCINEQLRYLNNKHYLTFKQTGYTLTTTAGVSAYDLTKTPYNQEFWRVHRIARNGVVKVSNDWPLTFIDYTQRDYLKPTTSNDGEPRYYSAYGENLLLFPPPDGSQLMIRYYGLHIGTDDTGASQKLRLSEADDLTMLNDEWEDVLTVGAAMLARGQRKVDEKYEELKRQWEGWENILIDMGNQPGEEAGPQFVTQQYCYSDTAYRGKYYPFLTDVPGA